MKGVDSREGHATSSDGLTQVVQASVQPLARIKLSVRNQPARTIQDGMQQRLHFAAAGPLHVRAT
jgi:hypothetical protein